MAVFVVDGFSSEPRVGEKTNHGDDINENTDGDGDSQADTILASHHFRLETCLPEIRAQDIVTDGGMDTPDNIILSKPNNKPKLPPKPTNISVKMMDFKRGAGTIDKLLIENYDIKSSDSRKLTGGSVINVSDNLKYDTLNNNLAVPTLATTNIQSDSNNNSNHVIKINCDVTNIGTEEKDDSLRSTGSVSKIPVVKSGANARSGHRTQVTVPGGNVGGQQPVTMFRLGPETGHCSRSVTPRLTSHTPDLSRSSTPGPRMTSLIPRPTHDHHHDKSRSVTPGPRLTSLIPRPFTPSSRSRRGSTCGLDTWGHRSLSGPGSLSRIPLSVRLSSDNIEVGLGTRDRADIEIRTSSF